MSKIILTLIIVLVNLFISVAQSNDVTIRIKLYPIQILEINTDKEQSIVEVDFANDSNNFQSDYPDYLSTYSTSHFVLKVNLMPANISLLDTANTPIPNPHSFTGFADLNDVFLAENIVEPLLVEPMMQVIYSMEAL